MFAFIFLFCVWGTSVLAADPATEMEQLRQEVNKLLKKIDDLEKKQTETDTKAEEAQKKAIEVEKKAGETEKKFAEVEKKTDTLGKKFKLDLSAQIRAFYLNRDKEPGRDYRSNYFEIYKLRLAAKGEVGKLIQFYAMVDANENEEYAVKLWEAAVQFTFLPELVLKIGEVRMPFSRHNFTARHQSPVMSSDGDIFLPAQFKDALKAVNPYAGGFRSTDAFKRTDFGAVIAGSISDGMLKYYAALANGDRSVSNKVWKSSGGFSSATLEAGESAKDKRGLEYDARIEFTPTMLGFKSEGTVSDPALRVRQTYLGDMDTMTLGIGYHHEQHLSNADESLYNDSSLSRDAWAADFSFEKKFGEYITGLELGYMNFDDTHFYQSTGGDYKKGGAWTTYADAHLIYGKKIWMGFPGIGLRYEHVNVDGEFSSAGETEKDLVYKRYGACLSYWFSSVTRIGIGVDFVNADDALKAYINNKGITDKGSRDSTAVWYLGVYTQI